MSGSAAAGSVPETTRRDGLLDGRVRLHQPRSGYRVAVDPVLLAAACPATAGARVLDLGCGVGAASLCLLARVPDLVVVGLELQSELTALARANAAQNGAADRFAPVVGDVGRPPVRAAAFDHVIANPPYHRAGHGRAPSDPIASAANVETRAELTEWLAAACGLVRPKGTVTLIHRADRLDEVLTGLRRAAGDIAVRPIRPKPGADARRVVVHARPGVAAPMRLAPDLVLHGADGEFTPEAQAVLRAPERLTV